MYRPTIVSTLATAFTIGAKPIWLAACLTLDGHREAHYNMEEARGARRRLSHIKRVVSA